MLFGLVVAAAIRKILALEAFDARVLAVLGATELVCDQLIESLDVVTDALVLLLCVVLRKLGYLFLLDEVRHTLARVHILVDLHQHFLRLRNETAI